MALNTTNNERAQRLHDLLDEQVREALEALRSKLDNEEELGLYLQIVIDVLAFHLGHTDAYACLGNIPRDSREAVRLKAFQEGQNLLLKEHDHDCSGGAECPELLRVLREVLPN